MNDKTFQGIMAGLEDAIAFVKGDASRGRTVAGPDDQACPERAEGAIRAKTRLSQAKFADSRR